MAKRRLWDSTSQQSVENHLPLRAFSLGFLLLLTSLISINCASFGLRRPLSSIKSHQFSSAPAAPAADLDETNQLDNLIGQWSTSPVSQIGYEALPAFRGYHSTAASQLQQPPQQPAVSIANGPLLADDRQKFYNQLESLAGNNYYQNNNQNDEDLAVRPASDQFVHEYQLVNSPNNNDYEPPNQLASSRDSEYSYSYSSPTSDNIGNNIGRKKLLELLAEQNVNDDEPIVRQLSDDYRYLLEQNPKHISIYQPLDGEAATSTSDGGDASASMLVDSPNSGGQDLSYQVDKQQRQQPQSEPPTEKRSPGSQEDNGIRANITLTTLLDDEDDAADADKDDAKKTNPVKVMAASESSSGDDDKTASDASSSTKQADKPSVSYGKVVTEKSESKSALPSLMQATGLSKVGSMLNGLYNYVYNSWPAALSVGSSSKSTNSATKDTLSSPETASLSTERQRQQIDEEISSTTTTTTTFAKPSVSEPANKQQDVVVVEQQQQQQQQQEDSNSSGKDEERNKWSTGENNDKRTAADQKLGQAKIEQQTTTTTSKDDYETSQSSEQSIRVEPKQQLQSADGTQTQTTAAFESTKRESKQVGGHKISLLRQSTNLVVPFKSTDELIVEAPASSGSNNNNHRPVLGKYIYAPEHHYHLGDLSSFAASKRPAGSGNIDADADDDAEQMFVRMAQRASAARQIHAGDDVFSADSAFSSLRPFYSHSFVHDAPIDDRRADRLGLLPKSNDIYFLVMVAAFCAMAMTVVLAAGLFAYRVQQSRKSSSEADYPTYGVVGPNNMSAGMGGAGGKCGGGGGGAASFVGGYFTGMGGPGSGSSSSASKSGSVKQLADMYSIGADSGIGGVAGATKRTNSGKRVILANDQAVSGVNAGAGQGNNNNNNSGGGGGAQANRFANQNAARMFHYQHQKQQMIISDRSSNGRNTSASDLDSEDENDENSYTVYECPGLASAHEMEIKNPLFNDDQTP